MQGIKTIKKGTFFIIFKKKRIFFPKKINLCDFLTGAHGFFVKSFAVIARPQRLHQTGENDKQSTPSYSPPIPLLIPLLFPSFGGGRGWLGRRMFLFVCH